MKSMKYLAIVSAIMLALAGCDKKERPATETPKTTEAKPAEPKAEEKPALVCDESELNNRVLSLVRDGLLKSSANTLQESSNLTDLEEVLKVRMSTLTIELDNIKESKGQCSADLRVVLSEADVANADKAFAKAGLPSLAEQAKSAGLEFVDGHLMGNITYKVDGETLSVPSDNALMKLASQGLASALVTQSAPAPQPKPAPTTTNANTTTNAQPARPAPRSEPQQPARQPARPAPAEQPSRPSVEPRRETPRTQPAQPQQPAKPRVETKPTPTPTETAPKPTARAEEKPKTTTRVEEKPEPSVSHKPVTDNSSEITIIESDETY